MSESLILAITALLAVVLGPVTTIYIANNQIKATTVAANRQQWINALRDELSAFLASVAKTGALTASRIEDGELLRASIDDLCRRESKIRLMLNPNEKDHNDLAELLNKASSMVWYTSSDGVTDFSEDLDYLINKIIEVSQPILKREWVRVKNLD